MEENRFVKWHRLGQLSGHVASPSRKSVTGELGGETRPRSHFSESGFARRFALHNVEMSLLRHLQTLASMRQKMQNHASRNSLSQYGAIKTGGYDLPLVARNPF